MNIIIDKLKQESTWRGLIGLTAAAGITLEPEMIEAIVALALASVGLINLIKNK